MTAFRDQYRKEINSAKVKATDMYIQTSWRSAKALWNVVDYYRKINTPSERCIAADNLTFSNILGGGGEKFPKFPLRN